MKKTFALKKGKYLLMKLFPFLYFTPYWIGLFTSNKTGNVVQIGSNDGKVDDPLYNLICTNKSWKVFFVEPVTYIFNKLKENYPKENRFTFCNVAVNKGQKEFFYWLDPKVKNSFPDLPSHFDKLGSFKRENIVNHLGKKIEPFIKEQEIVGLSLMNFFKEYSIHDLLLLHIDTEGYDWSILQQLNLNKFHPAIIQFEHKHLTKKEKEEAFKFLDMDYKQFLFGQDVLCIHRARLSELSKWQKVVLFRRKISSWN